MSRAQMFSESAPFEQILHQRLRWMVRLRWLVGPGIFLTIFLADRVAEVGYVKAPLYTIVAFIFFYNLGLEVALSRLGQSPLRRSLFIHANIQIGLDFFSLLLLVTFTGGVQNLFVFYVIFNIVIGSILLPGKNAMAVTIIICLICSLLFWADYQGLIPQRFWLKGFLPESVHHNRTYIFGLTYIFATVVLVTSYMAITISKNLRDADRRLLTLTREIYQQRTTCEQQNQELMELERKKTEFLHMAAKQLRTPLISIRELAEGLASGGGEGGGDNLKQDFDSVREQSETLLKLVDDMLESARLRDLEWSLPREQVDLSAIARRAVAALRDLARQKGVELRAEIAVGIPVITGDTLGWPKVFANLIENAIRYSSPGGVVEFRLDRDWQGEWITGEIKDQGMGIAGKDLELIFGEFFRAPEAQKKTPGTGMGLFITRRVIELHGGRIEVASKPGAGTVVKFDIPVKGAGAVG